MTEMAPLRRSPRCHAVPLPVQARTADSATAAPRSVPPAPTPTPIAAHASASRGAPVEDSANTGQEGPRRTALGSKAPGCTQAPNRGDKRTARGEEAVLNGDLLSDSGMALVNSADSRPSLPLLLEHLATGSCFTLDCDARAFRDTAPGSASPARRFSSPAPVSTAKRPCSHATPNPHLTSVQHTKKRKLRHRFLRSDLLLAGPSPSPPAIPSAKRPRTAASTAWWPSVSRSHGEGTESRFAREEAPEAAECGTGSGWVDQFARRFGGLRVAGDDALQGLTELRSRSRSRGRSRERGGGGRGRRELDLYAPSSQGRPAPPSRANSSPAVFGVSGLRTAYEAPVELQQQEELEGPALKKALLANLRARMAGEGGTSRGAEAGLRFKKWVVWNAWRVQVQPPVVAASDESGGPDSAPYYGMLGFSDDEPLSPAQEALLADVDPLLLPNGDELPALPEEYAGLAEQSDGLVDEPTTISPLSLLLLSEDESPRARDEILAVPPPLARPPIRRTASLPNTLLGGVYGEEQGHVQPLLGTWEVLRPAVACEA